MGYAPGPGTTAEALGTLRQLQAYLCEYLAPDNVSAVFEMVRVDQRHLSLPCPMWLLELLCVCVCAYYAAIYNHC